jgi:AraC-like DNA-binding protein
MNNETDCKNNAIFDFFVVLCLFFSMKKRSLIIIILIALAILSLAALLMLPNKVLFTVLLVIFVLGLAVYYLFSGNEDTDDAGRKNYSDFIIVEELDRFFSRKKPYLKENYKISDLEKQLKVSSSAISSFTKERFDADFNQFLNLWRIAELQKLQSLIENEDVSIDVLCLKAGFSNTRQYHLAEKLRKAKKKKKGKSQPNVNKLEIDMFNELDIKKKPEIQRRV